MGDLGHHFAGGEIAEEAHLPGGTEDASHGATRLRADAEGVTLLVIHAHRFDKLPVAQLEQHFGGLTVARVHYADRSENVERGDFRQFVA